MSNTREIQKSDTVSGRDATRERARCRYAHDSEFTMITVLIHFIARESRVDTVRSLLLRSAEDRRARGAALTVILLQNKVDPCHFTMLETFDSQTSIDRYYATDHHRRLEAELAPLLSSLMGHDQSFLFGGPSH